MDLVVRQAQTRHSFPPRGPEVVFGTDDPHIFVVRHLQDRDEVVARIKKDCTQVNLNGWIPNIATLLQYTAAKGRDGQPYSLRVEKISEISTPRRSGFIVPDISNISSSPDALIDCARNVWEGYNLRLREAATGIKPPYKHMIVLGRSSPKVTTRGSGLEITMEVFYLPKGVYVHREGTGARETLAPH